MLFVLDLDDTLYLERNYVRSGFNAVGDWLSRNKGIDGFADKAWRIFGRGERGNIFNLTLSEFGLDEQPLVEQLVSIYRRHSPKIRLMSDSEEFLKSHGAERYALITDGFPNSQWAKIEALQIERYITKIIVTGDWGRAFWKPHPRAFETIQGRLNPSKCTYIADNPEKDFEAPRQLGWAASIRIRRKESLHYHIETPSDCIEINSLEDLI